MFLQLHLRSYAYVICHDTAVSVYFRFQQLGSHSLLSRLFHLRPQPSAFAYPCAHTHLCQLGGIDFVIGCYCVSHSLRPRPAGQWTVSLLVEGSWKRILREYPVLKLLEYCLPIESSHPRQRLFQSATLGQGGAYSPLLALSFEEAGSLAMKL